MMILAALVGRFSFALVPERIPYPVMILTLRPAGGIWLDIQPLEG